MKNSIVFLLKISVFSPLLCFSQVGINTNNPQATLDVNGNMKIRVIPETPTLPGYKIMAVNEGSFEVTNVSPSLFSSSNNGTVSKASSSAGLSLLSLDVGLFNNSWNIVKFENVEINSTNYTTTTADFYYTVPSAGKYFISYHFKNNTALSLSIATNAQIGILRTPTTGNSVLIDSRNLNAIGIALVGNYYFENIDSVYQLQAGDKIRFVYNKGGLVNLGLGLLSNSSGSNIIYKVSD